MRVTTHTLTPMPRTGGYCAQSKQLKDARLTPGKPEPSATRLAPRALSVGVIVSLAGVLSLSDHIFIGFIQSMLIDCIEDIV